MGGLLPSPVYRLPCCGRLSYQRPVAGHPCFDCAMASTPIDDPIAVAYRRRVAARATAEKKADV